MIETKPAETPTTAGVIAPPPLLLLLSLVAGFSLEAAAPFTVLDAMPPALRYGLGGALSVSAVALAYAGVRRFRRAGTPVNPYSPPTGVVADGVFGALRNPMYVGFYILSIGLAVAFAAEWLLATTVVLALVIHFGVIRREERFLERKFGAPYTDYRRRVKRYGIL